MLNHHSIWTNGLLELWVVSLGGRDALLDDGVDTNKLATVAVDKLSLTLVPAIASLPCLFSSNCIVHSFHVPVPVIYKASLI